MYGGCTGVNQAAMNNHTATTAHLIARQIGHSCFHHKAAAAVSFLQFGRNLQQQATLPICLAHAFGDDLGAYTRRICPCDLPFERGRHQHIDVEFQQFLIADRIGAGEADHGLVFLNMTGETAQIYYLDGHATARKNFVKVYNGGNWLESIVYRPLFDGN